MCYGEVGRTTRSGLELRPLPSTGITRLPRYYEPLRHPSAPGLSLTGVRLIIPDHALGFPVLRALSLCTCCRHYPGAAAGCIPRSSHPAVSAFPGRVTGSACTSTFSRLARRALALRPAHSRSHLGDRYPRASDISSPPCLPRLLPAGAVAGWALHPLEKRRLVTAHVDCGPPPGPARATSLRRFRTFSPLPRNGKGSTPRRHSQARFALPTAPRARPARIDGCVIGKIACIYLASCSQKLSA